MNSPAEHPTSTAPENPSADAGHLSAFDAFGLAPQLLEAVASLGFVQPTPVQQQTIGLAMAQADGRRDNLMVSSQTGSGKTAAFLLPVLHSLLQMHAATAAREKAAFDAQVNAAIANGEPMPKKRRRRNPKNVRHIQPAAPAALVLAPTRELAQQVARDAIDLLRHSQGLHVATVVGGLPYGKQIRQLQNADLVVATPGRLLDLQRSGKLRLKRVRFLIVDEADRMLDLGFADALAQIHALTAGRKQTLMFSATFGKAVQKLAEQVMPAGDTVTHRLQIDAPQEAQAQIRQELYWADNREHRRALLDHWLRDPEIDQAIVFASTRTECDALARDLHRAGFAAAPLHGGLSQFVRNRRLKALRDGKLQFLVATDVAARGLDVPTITHVFNYGLPMKAEDYTHRIGRTGRAGRSGLAVTLAEIGDRKRLAAIEAHTRKSFEPRVIDGLEPTKSFPPVTAPARRGGADNAGRKGKRGRKAGNKSDKAFKASAKRHRDGAPRARKHGKRQRPAAKGRASAR